MRRLSAATLALALSALLCASAGAAPAAAAAPPRAQLRGFACTHALDPSNRAVSVKAVMRPVTGTERMQLKFDLLATQDGSISSVVKGHDLDTWLLPKNPTLGQLSGDVWNFTKSVVGPGLGVPDTYQFKVSFRWIGASGRVIHLVVLPSRQCHLRELRPDLLVESPVEISPIPSQPNQDRYTAVIDNAGASAAGPFVVQFVSGAGGSSPVTQTVPVQRLPAFSATTLTFTGPLCTAGTSFTITADSTSEVDDLNRANNFLTALCPVATSSGAVVGTWARGRIGKPASAVRTSLYLVKR